MIYDEIIRPIVNLPPPHRPPQLLLAMLSSVRMRVLCSDSVLCRVPQQDLGSE